MLPKFLTSRVSAEEIPETWISLESFCDWYIDNGLPICPPKDTPVYISDDATSVCLFRKGQFQAELYLIHPSPMIQMHEHPDVNVIKIYLEGSNTFEVIGQAKEVIRNGISHGVGRRQTETPNGFPLLALQHWHPKLNPSTVAAAWKGKTAGPKHEELIRKLVPNAFVIDGYADTTKTMAYLEEFNNVGNT